MLVSEAEHLFETMTLNQTATVAFAAHIEHERQRLGLAFEVFGTECRGKLCRTRISVADQRVAKRLFSMQEQAGTQFIYTGARSDGGSLDVVVFATVPGVRFRDIRS
jgi:hypothetical protein